MTAAGRRAPSAARPNLLAGLIAATALLAVSCGAAAPPATSAPTAIATGTLGVATAPATATPDDAGAPGTTGVATVEIAGETFDLSTGPTPVCAFIIGGAQLSLASSDAQTTLSVNIGPSGAGSFLLATHLDDGELWAPTEAVPFDVNGNRATWTGTMRDSHSDREETVSISVDCDG